MKRLGHIFFWFLLFLPLLPMSAQTLQLLPVDASHGILDCRFQNPDLAETGGTNWVLAADEALTLRCRSAQLGVTLLQQEGTPLSGGEDVLADWALGADMGVGDTVPVQALAQTPWSLESLGTLDGWHYFRLALHSVYAEGGSRAIRVQRLQLNLEGEDLARVGARSPKPKLVAALRSTRSVQTVLGKTLAPASSQADRLKFMVDSRRVVWIPQSLLKASGWKVGEIDPRMIRVTCNGQEVPIYVAGEDDGRLDPGDGLEFWAEELWLLDDQGMRQRPMTRQPHVFWIEVSTQPGLRLGQEPAFGPSRPVWETLYPRSAPVTLHVEKDNLVHRLPYATGVSPEDHWLMGGVGGGEKAEFTFELPEPDIYALSPPTLRVRLRGQTQLDGSHGVELFLNEAFLCTGSWQGNQGLHLETDEINPIYLREGTNTLSVVNRSTDGALAQLYLDAFELTYPRLLKTQEDWIDFSPPANGVGRWVRYEVGGFAEPDVRVMRVGRSRFYRPEINAQTDTTGRVTYALSFEDEVLDAGTAYVAYTPSARWTPDSLSVGLGTDLAERTQEADYLVIAPHDSLGEAVLQPLLALRQSQGHRTAVALYPEIVDAYNHGLDHPEAIRRFLADRFASGSGKLAYVLLVGDGSYDYRRTPEQDNLMPVPIYQTEKYGASASDHWYACLTGGDDADVAIGRLPVTTVAELERGVAKIVDYETQSTGSWRNRYLMIGSGSRNTVFPQQSDWLIRNVLPRSLRPERLFLSGDWDDPYVGGTEDLLRHLRTGAALVNFRGHGGGAIWADAGLLDLDDIDLLENRGRLPVMTSMTCFTGDFSSTRTCLGEALLYQTEAGAVAFWGATGVGWVYNDYYLLTALYALMAETPNAPLGQLIKEAKAAYLAQYGSSALPLSEVYQYTLLGDPALRMTWPSETLDASLSGRAFTSGEAVGLSGSTEFSPAQIEVQVTDASLTAQSTQSLESPQADWQASVDIPASVQTTDDGVRLYAWQTGGQSQAHGFLPFRLNSAFFDSVVTVPPAPQSTDLIRVRARIEGKDGVRRAWCKVLYPQNDSLAMEPAQQANVFQTVKGIGPLEPGSTLIFAVGAEDGQGFCSMSDTVSVRVLSRTDLAVGTLAWGASDAPSLTAQVSNWGDESASTVTVRFKVPDLNLTLLDTVDVAGGETVKTSVACPSWLGPRTVRVTVDPDEKLAESRRDNNEYTQAITPDRFVITPALGSVLGGEGPHQVGFLDRLLLVADPQSSADTVSVHMAQDAESGGYILDLSRKGVAVTLGRPARMALYRSPADSAACPYIWQPELDRWVALDHEVTDSTAVFEVTASGRLTWMSVEDQTAPQLRFQVEDQPFAQGSYVGTRSAFLLMIEDASGVDARPGHIVIQLDGAPVPESQWIAADSLDDPTRFTVRFRPTLSAGNHTLQAEVSDIHGNRRVSDLIDFQVGDKLAIQYLGNHPNPFQRETVFAYVLTDAAEKVTLRVYTVDGQRIRSFEDAGLAAADYHEVLWDGLDDWGEPVANGVYFFKIHAKGRSRSVDYTGKIAKLR